MMGMGNCCLGSKYKVANRHSKVWDRKKGQSGHRYVSQSFHSDGIR